MDKINKIIKKYGPVFTAKIARKNNINRSTLSRLVKEGKLFRIARGKYSKDNMEYDEYFTFQAKYTKCIFSYDSALFLHQLTEKIPTEKVVTVYKGYNYNNIKEKVIIKNVEKKYYDIGIVKIDSIFGNPIIVYNMERTICDIVKSRKKIDSEVFTKAIKLYAINPKRDYIMLRKYAKIFNIEDQINQILEVI